MAVWAVACQGPQEFYRDTGNINTGAGGNVSSTGGQGQGGSISTGGNGSGGTLVTGTGGSSSGAGGKGGSGTGGTSTGGVTGAAGKVGSGGTVGTGGVTGAAGKVGAAAQSAPAERRTGGVTGAAGTTGASRDDGRGWHDGRGRNDGRRGHDRRGRNHGRWRHHRQELRRHDQDQRLLGRQSDVQRLQGQQHQDRSAICEAVIDCIDMNYPCNSSCQLSCFNGAGASGVAQMCVTMLLSAASCM